MEKWKFQACHFFYQAITSNNVLLFECLVLFHTNIHIVGRDSDVNYAGNISN
jgi:hypothetical protein